jgi:hypothetical protein
MSSPSCQIDLKSIPVQYAIEVDCTKETLPAKLEEVASLVSQVYLKFLVMDGAEREELRKKGFWFDNTFATSPTVCECFLFSKALKQRIINTLSQEEDYNCVMELSTDYFPGKILCEVARDIFANFHKVGLLFPAKTYTRIYLKENKTILCLTMNFKGPLF